MNARDATDRQQARMCLAIMSIIVLAIVLRLIAYAPFDLSHADELMQYLEQGNRLVTGTGIAPWEARAGLRNSLIPQLLAGPLWLGHTIAPGTLLHVHFARLTFMALSLVALAGSWRLGALTSCRHALVALFVAATWWESILFSDLLLSETLASALLLLAAGLLLDPAGRKRSALVAGLLIGLGVLVRLQYAPFAAMLVGWALLRHRHKAATVMPGLVAAGLIGAISDLIAGRVPFAWVLVNFGKNIGEGIAARFGASPPWQYLVDLYLHLGPGALVVVPIGALASGRRYHPLLAAAIVNVAAHSLVAHKEYRFIWLSTLVLVILAAIGSVRIVDYLLERRGRHRNAGWPSMLMVMAAWALLSIASFAKTGGYTAFRGGGVLTQLAIDAVRRPEVCRLAVDDSYRPYVLPSVLPRDVPLSIVPHEVADRSEPLPPDLALAANAVLAQHPPRSTEKYTQIACERLPDETPCLYLRAGGCAPDHRYDYQTVLTRGGL